MKKLLSALLLSGIMGLSWAEDVPTRAEFTALEQRVSHLEQALHQQSNEVQASAASIQKISAAVPTTLALANNPDQWALLKSGMPESEVLKALGTPSRRMPMNNQMMWYYATPNGNGSVIFNHTGLLIGIQKPPFHSMGW